MQTLTKKIPLIMGILNLTPDSFSDGGKFIDVKSALKRVKELEKNGADIIDIGGEASGPNSKNVSLEEEKARVLPILKVIRKITKLPISLDTYKAELAEEALSLGVNIINDITGLRGDPNMAKVIAKYNARIVLMYSKDPTARTTLQAKTYQDIIKTITNFLAKQIAKAEKSGIKKENLIIDPGMGHFISSIPRYSFEVISRLKTLQSLECPILVGLSRKSFLGGSVGNRDEKGHLLSAIAYLNGASIIRTHDPKGLKEFFLQLNK